MTRAGARWALSVLGIMLVVGCVAVVKDAEKDTPSPDDPCNARAFQGLIGAPSSAADAVPEPKRVFGPQAAVTMDYIAHRTNVRLDEAGMIIAITCG